MSENEALTAELRLRASIHAHRSELARNGVSGMAEQVARDEAELLAITECLDEHPEDFDGPCACGVCLSYADEAQP